MRAVQGAADGKGHTAGESVPLSASAKREEVRDEPNRETSDRGRQRQPWAWEAQRQGKGTERNRGMRQKDMGRWERDSEREKDKRLAVRGTQGHGGREAKTGRETGGQGKP